MHSFKLRFACNVAPFLIPVARVKQARMFALKIFSGCNNFTGNSWEPNIRLYSKILYQERISLKGANTLANFYKVAKVW